MVYDFYVRHKETCFTALNTWSSIPVGVIFWGIAYTCNIPQILEKCCKSRGLRHFFFGLLLSNSAGFHSLRQ